MLVENLSVPIGIFVKVSIWGKNWCGRSYVFL